MILILLLAIATAIYGLAGLLVAASIVLAIRCTFAVLDRRAPRLDASFDREKRHAAEVDEIAEARARRCRAMVLAGHRPGDRRRVP